MLFDVLKQKYQFRMRRVGECFYYVLFRNHEVCDDPLNWSILRDHLKTLL